MDAKPNEQPSEQQKQLAALAMLVHNVMSSRTDLMRQWLDPRRDINTECGYLASPTAQDYQGLYDREAIATRVVEVLPKQSWKVQPTVYEDPDEDVVTEFELAWDNLGKALRGEQSWHQDETGSPIWEYLLRADILSGIGQYGIILLGIDDGKQLSEPAEPATTETASRRLLFIRVFPESLATIARWEEDVTSPRFGRPVEYDVVFSDPRTQSGTATIGMQSSLVHWTRVIHVADNLESNESLGVPRMRSVLNRLTDLQKIYGADGEAYWRNAILKLFFESDPKLGGDVTVDVDALRDETEKMMNSVQQWMLLKGLTARAIPPAVIDPTAHIAVHIEAICIKTEIPKRIFMGSERGDMASSQDTEAWNTALRARHAYYLTPRVIIPLVDRLIWFGVLPKPKGYSVAWPDLASQTDEQKAEIASKVTSALVQYVTGGVETLLPPLDYFTLVLKMDQTEAQAILERAALQMEGDSDQGGSRLLGFVGGIDAMANLFQKTAEGVMSTESLKQIIMTFYKVDEARAAAIVAEGPPALHDLEPEDDQAVLAKIGGKRGKELPVFGKVE